MPADPILESESPRSPASCRCIAWRFATVAWAVQMFHFSTDAFSSDKSRSVLARMLDAIHVHLSLDILRLLNVFIRSLAHVVEYGILLLLVYRSIAGRRGFEWHRTTACWSAVIAFVFCLFDEFHQALVPSRGSSLVDCAIDTAGIAIAVLFIHRRSMRASNSG